MAYHLHRLKLTGKKLRDCKFCPTYQASELAQGRVGLGARDVERLAMLLNVPVDELSRPLTPCESFGWEFYRESATQGALVWQRAKSAWEAQGMSLTQAATIMGIERSVVTRNTRAGNLRGYRVFPLSAAKRLSFSLGLLDGASFFIRNG